MTAPQTPIFRIERFFFALAVYANRVEIVDRTGCTGPIFPRRETILIRNITSVDANPGMEILTIHTSDGKRRTYRVMGTGKTAKAIQEAISRQL